MRRRRPGPTAALLPAAVPAALWAAVTAWGAASTAPADPPDAHDVREQLLAYTRDFAGQDQATVRRAFCASARADRAACDRDADYVWRSSQAMAAVRDRWGAAAEAKFGHVIGADTVEDDAAAQVRVTDTHATVAYPGGTPPDDHLVKVDGKWLLDEAAYRDARPVAEPYPTTAMKEVVDDVRDGQYDDVDDLIEAVEENLGIDRPDPDAGPPARKPANRR